MESMTAAPDDPEERPLNEAADNSDKGTPRPELSFLLGLLFALPHQRGNFDPMITMRFSCVGGEGEFTQYGDDR